MQEQYPSVNKPYDPHQTYIRLTNFIWILKLLKLVLHGTWSSAEQYAYKKYLW